MSQTSQSSGSSDSSDVVVSWEDWLHLRNDVWRDYRIKGTEPSRTTAQRHAIYEKNDANPPPLPNPRSLHYFENWNWRQSRYMFGQYTGNRPNGPSNPNANPNFRDILVQEGYREITAYFGQPRYHLQNIIGAGGNGLAVHFKDCDPDGVNDSQRDFVVKVSLGGWQSDDIAREKMMMKKVQGSAHCVQLIDAQDIGKPEDEPVVLPIPDYDSSIDGDSSGNESLKQAEVFARHRIPKRRRRRARYWQRKNQKRMARAEEIEKEIERQEDSGMRMDYIIMEYLQNGNLASLIVKLNQYQLDHGIPYRIPNRVLWEFWLCLIRACIAMEYPPRKFHPLRKKPQPPVQLAVDYLRAKANKMIRECKALGIQLLYPGQRDQLQAQHAREEAQYELLQGDLLEDLPERPGGPDQWKMERRQNMIHRDLDPTNVFINGLELDEPGLILWKETRETTSQATGSANASNQNVKKPESLNYTSKRPDRIAHEHELVPRLKLGDFGNAACIKQQKSNEYYHAHREGGKVGEYPPEFFGPEWEKVEVDRYGDQLADSRTCGYYSNKTNIWNSALTMWELITGLQPPTPPAPQPPYDQIVNYPPFNNKGQSHIDMIFQDPRYADFKISYCALLCDPGVSDYDWVDEDLRQTIFKCLYHKPDDRPSLSQLLLEAERKVELDASGDPDEFIRQWIQHWVFDTPPAPPARQSAAHPGAQPPVPPVNLVLIPASPPPSGAQLAPGLVMRARLDQLNADFPYGYDRIYNPATGNLCGLFALADSLTHQLGLNPTINGVTHHLNSLPTMQDLREIHEDLLDSGALDAFIVVADSDDGGSGSDDDSDLDGITARENLNLVVLGRILIEWSQQNNIELELVCKQQQTFNLHLCGSPYLNPKFIYIYNDGAEYRNSDPNVKVYNHFEGLIAKPPPQQSSSDSASSLPDYQSTSS